MANKKKTLYQKIKRWLLYSVLAFIGGSVLLVALAGILPLNTSSFMIQQHIADFNNDKGFISIKQDWRNKDAISPHMFSAVIAAEDQLFFQHHGFDFNSIYSALKARSSGKKLRGASTISQQVAKNLFLSPSRSLWRKGLEAWFTLLIELLWSKDRILLVYVNIAQFGDHIYGVQAASLHYFNSHANQLSPHQAALLAGSLPNPIIFKVAKPSPFLLKKQQWILRQMRNLNYL